LGIREDKGVGHVVEARRHMDEEALEEKRRDLKR